MSDNEIMKVSETALDGFDSDADESQSRRVIQGVRVAFTNDFEWVDNNDETISPDRELIMVDRTRVLQKWVDQMPVETRFLEPDEKWPDVEAMNEAAPRSEWREGPSGKPQGPWSCQWIIYLVDPLTLDKFTYPTNTTGGHLAVRDISDRIKNMRRFRGEHVYPVITLSDAFMNTRFGGRQRPHFKIVRWVRLGSGGGQVEALPPPPPPMTKPADEPAPSQPDLPLHEVKEPSLAEELNDSIPDFGNEDAKAGTTNSGFTWSTTVGGYHINPRNGRWIISKDGKDLHQADSESAALAWTNALLEKTDKKKRAKTSTTTGKRRLTNLDAG
jgi:hypothetical protein